LTAQIGFIDGKIVERFDCYEGTSAKAKLSKDLYVQGMNFFARKPELPGKTSHRESKLTSPLGND
jgi:hypothetical protein